MTVKNVDNKLIPVAKRYSDAILETAKENDILDMIFNDLTTVCESLDSVGELKSFLSHPVISFNEKKEMVTAIFSGRVNNLVLNLLYILLESNKIALIDTILYCYQQSLDEAKNILTVGVVSAVKIDKDLKEKLQQKLEEKFHKNVKFDFNTNSDIIAGLILKIKDKTIDGSVASKIEAFKKTLK